LGSHPLHCSDIDEPLRRAQQKTPRKSRGGCGEIQVQHSLISFDVYGTLVSVRDSSYEAFRSILRDSGRPDIDVRAFWEYWEDRNIAHYWEPYRPYKQICELSLAEAFEHFEIAGRATLIQRYFDAFRTFDCYPDVRSTLEGLSRQYRLAIVSNIDDDLLSATPLPGAFDLICTAERARGYKPDGTLFRYLIDQSGVGRELIFHAGQSQFTDLVGGKPLGLTIAWINRRGVELHSTVPRPDFILNDIGSLVPLLIDVRPSPSSAGAGREGDDAIS
jgi:2-haloacid dehalogenase